MKVLFRAKEKNSNNYVIGYEYYNHVEDEYYITHYVSGSNYKVDRTTRSINIEDMIDSQGNKIFASLREDGKGGDITLTKDGKALYERVHLCFKDGGLGGIDLDIVEMLHKKYNGVLDIKVIGIKE